MMREVDRAIPCAMGSQRAKRPISKRLAALAFSFTSRMEWRDPPWLNFSDIIGSGVKRSGTESKNDTLWVWDTLSRTGCLPPLVIGH
jgi:hypothetical protein